MRIVRTLWGDYSNSKLEIPETPLFNELVLTFETKNYDFLKSLGYDVLKVNESLRVDDFFLNKLVLLNSICKDIFCDETLFQWYSKYHHIHIHSLQVLPGIKWVTHLNKVDMIIDTLYIIHTIVGDNVYNTDIIELINEILK